MKNVAILLGLILLAAGYTYFADRHIAPKPQSISAAPAENRNPPAPDFSFRGMDGKAYALKDFSGRVVLLNFWASWCAPCVIEFPQMLDLARAMPEEISIIFLSQDDTDDAITAFLKKQKFKHDLKNVIIARDEGQEIARELFQTYRLPETYILTPDLKIADKIIGADIVWNGGDMQQKLHKIHRGD